jgi:hypothetical protein
MLTLLLAMACAADPTTPVDAAAAPIPAAPVAPPPAAPINPTAATAAPPTASAPAGWPAPSTWVAPQAAVLRAEAPGCEASAALSLGADLLVGDNELDDALVLLSGGPSGAARALPLPLVEGAPWKIRDIEALTRLPTGVAVVGSGGLRSAESSDPCGVVPDRARIGVLDGLPDAPRWSARTALPTSAGERPRAALSSPDACRRWLLPGADAPGRAQADALCAALATAERAAAAGDRSACAQAWNVEAALTDAEGRLWIGLRAPAIPGGAALLRVAEASWAGPSAVGALQIDGVATLAGPAGMGLRGLDSEGGLLVALFGPEADAKGQAHALAAAPLAALQPGATVSLSYIGAAPPSAEGVLLSANEVLMLVDGDEPDKPKKDPRCSAPSTWLKLPRPALPAG